jgi:hypothetical protein
MRLFFFLMRGGTGPSSRSRSACLRALLGIASPAIDEIRWWYGARACVDVDSQVSRPVDMRKKKNARATEI